MKKTIWNTFIVLLTISLLWGCSKEEEKGGGTKLEKSNVNGSIEKGPFLTGSKVTLYELDENLEQTGKNFKTETINDKGNFSFPKMSLSSQYVELEISGYFYNEIEGDKSDSQITLNAITDLSSKEKVNANILTHLEYKRVKALVAEGKSFSEAKKQAEKELLKVFYIAKEIESPENISLTDGNENAAVLLAISSIVLYDKKEAEFSEFASKLSNDFAAGGTITDVALLNDIREAGKNVDAVDVMENVQKYYKEQGSEITVSNIRKFIDGNGDGVLDEKDETIENGGLEEKPSDQVASEEVFQHETDFANMLAGGYFFAFDYSQRMIVMDAVRCGEINNTGLNFKPDADEIYEAWFASYKAIRMFNVIIEQETKTNFSFDVKPYVAAAKTLRAFVYLDMVQHWGDVPFVTKTMLDNNNLLVPRTPEETILVQLLSDLDSSISDLKEDVDFSQLVPTKDFANALMGTIALERKDYNGAVTYLKKIVDTGSKYTLCGKSPSIYQDKANLEIIFSFQRENVANVPFFNQINPDGVLHPIYRYTGVLLNYAEALCRIGQKAEAIEVINKVKQSIGMPALPETVDNIPEEIASLWKNIIGMDYGYFTLLKRLGLAVSELKIQEYEQLYPIPQREIDLNPKLVQNPGYKK
ncbi:MAG: hypothetical protein PARBA_01733 [Parabacteroides sp.]